MLPAVDLLQKHLERSQNRVQSLEKQLRDAESSLQQRGSRQLGSYRPLPMRHSADNLQSLDTFADQCNWCVSVESRGCTRQKLLLPLDSVLAAGLNQPHKLKGLCSTDSAEVTLRL